MLVRMSQDDCRCILGRNVRLICARWDVSEIELWQKWKLGRLSLFTTDEMNEYLLNICFFTYKYCKMLTVNFKYYRSNKSVSEF